MDPLSIAIAGGSLVGDLVSSYNEEEQKEAYFKQRDKQIDIAINQYSKAKERTSKAISDNINDMSNISLITKDQTLKNSLIGQSSQLRSTETSQLNAIDQAIATLKSDKSGGYKAPNMAGNVVTGLFDAASTAINIDKIIKSIGEEDDITKTKSDSSNFDSALAGLKLNYK